MAVSEKFKEFKEFKIKLINNEHPWKDGKGLLNKLKLWHNIILKKDDKWHFFYEPAFIIIRVSNEIEPAFDLLLRESVEEISYEIIEWEDHEVVAKYADYYINLFHLHSELVIKLANEEINPCDIDGGESMYNTEFAVIVDRMCHPFFNMYCAISMANGTFSAEFEPLTYSKMAAKRGYFNGHGVGYNIGFNRGAEAMAKHLQETLEE